MIKIVWGTGGIGKMRYTTTGGQTMVNIKTQEASLNKIENFELYQNYPNPFNSETFLEFLLPFKSKVNLRIFDTRGKLQRTLLLENFLDQGKHSISFNASNLPSGIYFYELETENAIITKKMVLIK